MSKQSNLREQLIKILRNYEATSQKQIMCLTEHWNQTLELFHLHRERAIQAILALVPEEKKEPTEQEKTASLLRARAVLEAATPPENGQP